ncbi:MAG: NDP-sugar synthase [Endomicrobiia bacterium]|nr:NDP-sugar synthase [Endomicrobiia bacterium]
MKAFVMAAGAGTRLRPLTYSIPKPMVPVVNKPVLEHTVENLAGHFAGDIMMNLHYRGDMIKEYFGDGSKWGARISYSPEKKLMGTAGGVKKCEDFLKGGAFIVMSGDGLSDVDLSAVCDFHRRKKSVATMVLKAVDSKFDYGVTLLSPSGRIKKFIEKPYWSDVFSNTVNTGIYVFEPEVLKLIPPNRFYDFGQDLWPKMLKKGLPIYGYVTKSYWTDVGNLKEYRQGQRDALSGNIRLNIPGRQIKKGVYVGEGSIIHPSAKLIAPCVIGKQCLIEKNVIIGPDTVVAAKCAIAPGAVISNSILWGRVRVSPRVKLDNCIIGYRAKVVSDISVYEGTILNVD